jgi:ornithine cyclodeaminase
MTAVDAAMTVVTGSEVGRVIDGGRAECVDVVGRAYLLHAAGDSSLPHSSFLRLPEHERDRIIALPGYLGGEFDVAGMKWISSWPGNTTAGIPRASAVLILNTPRTGYPYACLEASLISASRTAASAVLAAERLTGGRTAPRIGIVGTGLIADHVVRFLSDLGWDVGGYRLFDLDHDAAERFADRIRDRGATDVQAADDVAGAFRDCAVVLLATVAGTPHLTDPALLAHRPVVLHLSLRDLSPELILAAQNVTDDVDHVLRERTSLQLAAQSTGHRKFLDGTLADVLAGRLARDPARATVFSPFGLGVLDLAVAKWVFDRVRADGGGVAVGDFFRAAT